MKVKEHVFAIKNLLAHGAASDDFSYTDRLIYHFLKITRARLLEQKINKYSTISPQSFQDLCVSLNSASFHECCDVIAFKPTCLFLKSTTALPKLLNSKWGTFLTLYTLDGLIIPELSITKNKYSKYSITQTTPTTGWFLHNNHLYILNNEFLEKIIVNGLFDNPVEIAQTNCSTSADAICGDYLDEEFPIDVDIIDPMYRLTLEFLLQSVKLPKDAENNSADNTTGNE